MSLAEPVYQAAGDPAAFDKFNPLNIEDGLIVCGLIREIHKFRKVAEREEVQDAVECSKVGGIQGGTIRLTTLRKFPIPVHEDPAKKVPRSCSGIHVGYSSTADEALEDALHGLLDC